MINKHHTARPAATAIAAVLVVLSTPVAAQTVLAGPEATEPTPQSVPFGPPADAAPTNEPVINTGVPDPGPDPVGTTSLPGATPPVFPLEAPVSPPPPASGPVYAPSNEIVQTIVPGANEVTSPAQTAVPARSARSEAAPQPGAPRERPAAETILPFQPGPAASPAVTAEAPSGTYYGNEPAAAPSPEPQLAASEDVTPWIIAGGAGALLALGAGAIALVGRRPRRPAERPVAPRPAATRTPVVASAATAEPAFVAPPLAPTFAATSPQGAQPYDLLEAMVTAPPSPANPFLTRRNRIRRARYLIAKGVPEGLTDRAQQQASRAIAEASAPAEAPRPAQRAPQPWRPTTQTNIGFWSPSVWKPA